MLYGPDQVIACPACTAFARVRTFSSGNNFGTMQWTDGKIVMPMMPRRPALTVCATCNTYYWLSDIPVVGDFSPRWDKPKTVPSQPSFFQKMRMAISRILPHSPPIKQVEMFEDEAYPVIPAAWEAAPYIESLSEEQYLEAIEFGLASNKEQERYVRFHALWTGNDWLFRDIDYEFLLEKEIRVRSEASAANLQFLFDLLDENDPHERLLQGEIMRELGQFEQAEKILDTSFGDELEERVSFIRQLIRKRETAAKRLPD